MESIEGMDMTNKTAIQNEDGTWTLNGEKLWCTNGVVADVIVVMAKKHIHRTNISR